MIFLQNLKELYQSTNLFGNEVQQLNPEILCAATYFDGAILAPERLCIEMIFDSLASTNEALSLNYCSLVGAEQGDVILRDQVTDLSFSVKPKIVVNATGPWIDLVNETLGVSTKFMGGTKGSHLILDHPELRQAIQESEIFFENKDGRIVLIYPFHDHVLIGTSDIFNEDPDGARCSEEEVDYFIEMISIVFPSIKVDRSHIVFRFSGVRPLPLSDSSAAGLVSRDHSIRRVSGEGYFPILSLVGGKWTTFRAFAEQVTDEVLTLLERDREVSTENIPIGGGRDFILGAERMFASSVGLTEERARVLYHRYGTRLAEFLPELRGGETLLKNNKEFSQEEIALLVINEHVVHLDDLVLRRTNVAKLGQVTRYILEDLADILARVLEWQQSEKKHEIGRCLRILANKYQVIVQ
ncbi:glycerol-3-phosphate dehydrogenase/oxidase [Chloroflexota bacterium]